MFGFKKGFGESRGKGNKGFLFLNPKTVKKYLDLHNNALKFATWVNKKSDQEYEPPALKCEENVLVRGCLYKIGEWAVTLHRAILSLCEAGWASATPILLRGMLDCLVNTIAILNPAHNSEYMAFKFYSLEYLNVMIEEKEGSVFDFSKSQVDNIISRMGSPNQKRAKGYVQEFLKRTERKGWWFKPEYTSTKEILQLCNKQYNMYFVFQIFSAVAHSTFFGFGLFKDKPDKADINPRFDPKSTKNALMFSSRLLCEVTNLRNEFEELKCDLIYKSLIKELVSLKSDFEATSKRGPSPEPTKTVP